MKKEKCYFKTLPYCISRQETKTKQFEKTITNPLKHVANCRATSSYKTLAEALDFSKLRLIMEGGKKHDGSSTSLLALNTSCDSVSL
jgi:hypothetical protein